MTSLAGVCWPACLSADLSVSLSYPTVYKTRSYSHLPNQSDLKPAKPPRCLRPCFPTIVAANVNNPCMEKNRNQTVQFVRSVTGPLHGLPILT